MATVEYTTAARVGSLLGIEIDTSTKPSQAEVEDWIVDVEDEIDRATHHSWMADGEQVVDEDHDFPMGRYDWQDWINGVRIKLDQREIRTATATDGSRILDKDATTPSADVLELYLGGSHEDYLVSRTGGRIGYHWVVPNKGWLFVKGIFRRYFPSSVRVTYRFGGTPLPGDIRRLATMMSAERVLEADRTLANVPSSADDAGMKVSDLLEKWEKDKARIFARRTEIVGVHR